MKICPNCYEDIYEDAVRCLNCNQVIPQLTGKCSLCENEDVETLYLNNKEYCEQCTNKLINNIVVTTTNSIEGYRIIKYIGIDSVEVVIGTGIWSEFTTEFQDFFGHRSTEFEKKLQKAKKITIQKIKLAAAQKGANAIVAMDLDYTEFSGNRIGVIASGTLVEIEH